MEAAFFDIVTHVVPCSVSNGHLLLPTEAAVLSKKFTEVPTDGVS